MWGQILEVIGEKNNDRKWHRGLRHLKNSYIEIFSDKNVLQCKYKGIVKL